MADAAPPQGVRHEEEEIVTRVEPLKAGADGQDLPRGSNEPSPSPAPEQLALVRQLQLIHETLAAGFAGDMRHWRRNDRPDNEAQAEHKYQHHAACARSLEAVLRAVERRDA